MQSKRLPLGWMYIIRMCVLRSKNGQLCIDTPLMKHGDDQVAFNGQLLGEALEIRKRLIDAVDIRFFISRYIDFDTDFGFDVQPYLHPAYKHFDYVPMLREVMKTKNLKDQRPPPSTETILILKQLK